MLLRYNQHAAEAATSSPWRNGNHAGYVSGDCGLSRTELFMLPSCFP